MPMFAVQVAVLCGCPVCLGREPSFVYLPRYFREVASSPRGDRRLAFLAELESMAFMRRMRRTPSQMAWDSCTEPREMVRALLDAREPYTNRLLVNVLVGFLRKLEVAWIKAGRDWQAKRHQLGQLFDRDLGAFTDSALRAYSEVGDDGEEFLSGRIRYYFPLAPWYFRIDEMHDEHMMQIALNVRCRLSQQEQSYVQALSTRKTLRPANAKKLREIVKRRVSWL